MTNDISNLRCQDSRWNNPPWDAAKDDFDEIGKRGTLIQWLLGSAKHARSIFGVGQSNWWRKLHGEEPRPDWFESAIQDQYWRALAQTLHWIHGRLEQNKDQESHTAFQIREITRAHAISGVIQQTLKKRLNLQPTPILMGGDVRHIASKNVTSEVTPLLSTPVHPHRKTLPGKCSHNLTYEI